MITIYGYDENVYKCVPCLNAKKFLTQRGKEFEFISIVTDKDENGQNIKNEKVLHELASRLGLDTYEGLTMPQIFNGDVHIGGFSDLKKYKF